MRRTKSNAADGASREKPRARAKGVHLRLPEELTNAAREFAAAKRVPISAIYEAALRAYLNPGAQDQRDAMLARQLNRFSRAVESVEWNTKLLVTMLGYHIELDLGYLPEAIGEQERESVEAKATRRFDRVEQWLVRQLVDPENLHNRLRVSHTPSAKEFVEQLP